MPSLNIYVTKEEKERLKEMAEKLGISVSDLVTTLLKEDTDGKNYLGVPNVQKIP